MAEAQTLQRREAAIRRWFAIVAERAGRRPGGAVYRRCGLYRELGSAVPCRKAVGHWFAEWNTRGRVLVWEIRQFFHKGEQTAVEWYFKNQMDYGTVEEFDGISLVQWAPDGRICALKEFGCNRNTYDPYAEGDTPRFQDEKAKWF